ncbi:MAG TPA: metallophosphoesterase [Nitrososphaeraceae archaeon]|jgi:UDP-2,3-diacylglucosamine pyrophosphatase LpxH|nr:metallophosphoesterase [Nitrososphaeraceae archaeon]
MSIIVVSDIHLGYDKSNAADFSKFVDSDLTRLDKNDHLVLLGDILEFWRRQNVTATLENEVILNKIYKLHKDTNVHYVIGNHDYSILKFYAKFGSSFPLNVTKALRLSDNDTTSNNNSNKKYYYFIHGYELEVLARLEPLTVEEYEFISNRLCERTEDLFGTILSNIWEKLKLNFRLTDEKVSTIRSITKPPEEREGLDKVTALAKAQSTRRIFLGIGEDEFLIFGHTHWPFLDKNNKVANTGSWIDYSNNSTAANYNTYLEIDRENIELKSWNT